MAYIRNHIMELLVGFLMFGIGLMYLNREYLIVKELTNIVSDKVLDSQELYQQHNTESLKQMSSKELCAIVMGYREYPIVIDGTIMGIDAENYEDYLAIIQNGYYAKSYEYDSENKIIRIVYHYLGIT